MRSKAHPSGPAVHLGMIIAVLTSTAEPGLSEAPTFTALGDLPGGGNLSNAFAVSADGSVVVGYGSSADGIEAFIWTAETGMVGLGDLPGGPFGSEAWGISDDGTVVAGPGWSAEGPEAFRWTAEDGMVGLGDLPGGPFKSSAWGVSGDGAVIVGQSDYDFGDLDQAAFRWTADEGMVSLGALPGGTRSGAHAANANGSVIVGFSYSTDGPQAFRWMPEDGMVGIGDLGGLPYIGEAFDVSADGSVIVGTGYDMETFLAARWTADEGWICLGDLPGGHYRSDATGVSADGSVIVGVGSSETDFEAFVWTARTDMLDLKQWLLEQGVTEVADWTLREVYGVSADGKTVVGAGQYPDSAFREAWVAHLGDCFPSLCGDLDGDGCVDQADLGILLADWGCTGGDCPGDCDHDGDTDQSDLGILLAHWGEGCP